MKLFLSLIERANFNFEEKEMVSTYTEELIRWDNQHLLHFLGSVGANVGVAFERAEGIKLIDSEGKQYIDFASQLVNVNLGHNRRDVAEAAIMQMNKMMYSSTLRGYSHVPSIEYGQKLAKVVPEGLGHFAFTMTGSDAVDCAFRIANLYWKLKGERRYKLISLFNSYHGHLRGTTSATGVGGGALADCPPAPGHIHIPNYFCYRCPFHKEYPSCGIECAEFLDYTIENEGKDSVAAFLVEPVQGGGGDVSPPPEYFPKVREICTKHGVLFIADEVMTGFTRTGKMFGVEHWNIKPDIMTLSKGVTSGYLPLGVVAVSDEVFNTLRGHTFPCGSTESGNPICCAVAGKCLDIYLEEHIAEHVATVGNHIRERLEKEFLPLPHVGSLSGLGLMLGLDIIVDKKSKALPSGDVASLIQERGLEHGLFLRIMANRLIAGPPLVITKEEADEALDKLYPIIAELKLN